MASIANDPNGRRRVLFVDPKGDRKAIRLGKIDRKSAEAIGRHVEALLVAKIGGQAVPRDTAAWLSGIGEVLRDKLGRAGLIPKPQQPVETKLGPFLSAYIERRTDVKESTMVHWRQARRSLLAYFGADRPLASITAGDAGDWERWLRTGDARENRYVDRTTADGLAPNTARKRVGDAKQFFQDAVARDLLVKNPFAGLKGAVGSNRARDFFVTREIATKVLDACPDAQWRLLFALSRFGGLRCPSEHLAMTWADVNWAEGRLVVRSAKTEHHEGKGTRLVPIFPELRPFLEDAFELAEPGSEYVITRYRTFNSNLRTQLERIIGKAGLEPWPKLFQNLRATRATELASEHPAHVAAAWLGHSALVANKHYWQVTEDDFAKATGSNAGAAQKAAQQAHAGSTHGVASPNRVAEEPLFMQDLASPCETLHTCPVGDAGLEPATSTMST